MRLTDNTPVERIPVERLNPLADNVYRERPMFKSPRALRDCGSTSTACYVPERRAARVAVFCGIGCRGAVEFKLYSVDTTSTNCHGQAVEVCRQITMKSALLTAVAAFSAAQAQNTTAVLNNTVTTWYSTSFISEDYNFTRTVLYGSSPVTPVPTFSANITILTTFINEPTVSRNINLTTWTIQQVTMPVETRQTVVYAPGSRTVNSSETATETTWVSPTLATVAFTSTTCTNGATPPNSTVTRYTGEYTPISGQATAMPTLWPTAVTSFAHVTASYRVYAYTGSTVAFTSTITEHAFPVLQRQWIC